MNGQWFGEYKGNLPGYDKNPLTGNIQLNIEKIDDQFGGRVFLNPNVGNMPGYVAIIKCKLEKENFRGSAFQGWPINPHTKLVDTYDNVKRIVDEFPIQTEFNFEGKIEKNHMDSTWRTGAGSQGEATLDRSNPSEGSTYPIKKLSWEEFKAQVTDREPSKYIYRGQSDNWKLRTSFHRTGKCDLSRYYDEVIPKLQKYISASTSHFFDINKNYELGALLSLAQHHGFPTPLLDWTESPYIAAFFAYEALEKHKQDGWVRIITLKSSEWAMDMNAPVKDTYITTTEPKIALHDFHAIRNKRSIPQQSITTFSNIDDIESFISLLENENKSYLEVIELPCEDRNKAMKELSYMGVTAGSLFPGIDGICRELAEKLF